MRVETRHEERICTVCGRQLAWRGDWGPRWLQTRYCSESCSERRLGSLDYRLEEATLHLLGSGVKRGSLPVAAVAQFVDPTGWESLLERALNAARRLAARGEVTIEGQDEKDSHLWGAVEMRLRLPN